jgi:single-stranded DNA-specific DHH superfamily exonuclease
VFEDFGGHESSGGFSILAEKIHELEPALLKAFDALGSGSASEKSSVTQGSSQTISSAPPLAEHDGILLLSEVTNRTYESLRMLAPFGMANKKPVFRFVNVHVDRVLLFGGSKDHVRLALSDEEGGDAEAIAFFIGRTSFKDDIELLSVGDRVTIDATVDRSFFAGRSSLRLRIENLTV